MADELSRVSWRILLDLLWGLDSILKAMGETLESFKQENDDEFLSSERSLRL